MIENDELKTTKEALELAHSACSRVSETIHTGNKQLIALDNQLLRVVMNFYLGSATEQEINEIVEKLDRVKRDVSLAQKVQRLLESDRERRMTDNRRAKLAAFDAKMTSYRKRGTLLDDGEILELRELADGSRINEVGVLMNELKALARREEQENSALRGCG